MCDTSAPTLCNVPTDIPCVEATSAAGALVYYPLPGSDDVVNGAVTVLCTPASGTYFPLGTTTVTCSAVDSRGNRASKSFTVKVSVVLCCCAAL